MSSTQPGGKHDSAFVLLDNRTVRPHQTRQVDANAQTGIEAQPYKLLPEASLTKSKGTFCPTMSRKVSTAVQALTSATS